MKRGGVAVHPDGSLVDRAAAARRIVDEVVSVARSTRRSASSRAEWCDPASADERFSARYDDAHCRAEATRMMTAIADAAADGADPD